MPRFRFQLEGVLRHRKNIEREHQRQVALVQARMHQLETELRQLDQSAQDAAAELRRDHLIGTIDLNYLAAHRRFIAATQRQAISLVQRMALVRRELDEKRQALTQAAIQRKVMEKLREKQLARWMEALNKREAEELDEIGMQLTYRHLDEGPEQQKDGAEA
jgi:flagellar FliJ protein